MQRSSKRLVISTERKNALGFRVRTAGIDLADFTANPLLLWMHKRPSGQSKDEILPLGYWADVQLEGDRITAVPVFDPDDDFAMTIYHKVEKGIIKMASAGLHPTDWQVNEDELWLERSLLKEASLVDIGSNSDAIEVALYNDLDELITLKTDFIQSFKRMEIIKLSGQELSTKLGLQPNELTPEVAMQKIGDLVTLADSQASTINVLKQEKQQAEQAKADAEQKHADLVKLQNEQKVLALVEGAVAERRITADQKEHFIKLAHLDFATTEATLKAMPTAATVKDQLKDQSSQADDLLKLSYTELDKQGKLMQLKAQHLDAFKAKFKEHFGKEYQG